MTKAEVIEHLKDILDDVPNDKCIDWIEGISVSERLPEEETDVLVCNVSGDVEISQGSYSTEIKDEFIWYTSGWRFGKVIAWMPLPEPYKEEKE